MGHAVKIIEIAEGNQTFSLNEGALKKILHGVPEDMEIAIVSVVSWQFRNIHSERVLTVGSGWCLSNRKEFRVGLLSALLGIGRER